MFKRKKKETDNVFQKLHHCCIKCVSVKDSKTYRETIVGREGTVNISENELVIVCQKCSLSRQRRRRAEALHRIRESRFR